MDNYQKFNQYLAPEKVNQMAQEIMSTMSEVQEIFLYLQSHTDLSIIGSLGITEQHLRKKEEKNLLHLLKPISDEFPDFRILPIYCSAVNHFNRHFPAAVLSEYIKAKAAVIEQQDFSQPENRIFLKVQAIDWEKIFAFLENHYFLLSLWNKIKAHHPAIFVLAKELQGDLLKALHNYLEAEDVLGLNCLTSKTKENKNVDIQLTSQMKETIREAMQQPVLEAFTRLKELALQEGCKLTDFELLLPAIKAALANVNLNKLSIKKVMLQKLLEYIKVDKGDESIQFLILHDLLKLLYPYKFTSDATFLEDGPIFNKNGNMDGEVRRKKIREVKMIMDIPINR